MDVLTQLKKGEKAADEIAQYTGLSLDEIAKL
jgi:hypothetical protein